MRAAIIGFGPQGKRVIRAMRALPAVELVAVADIRADVLASTDLPEDVLRTEDPEECWTQAKADLLCITTNGPSHAALAIAAMDAGVRRIMVEKPMACSVGECRQMLEVARRMSVRLAINQSRRHHPFYRWLREQIRSASWGELRSVWIQRPGIGLGCLGTHNFDLVRFLADRDVERVTAWVDDFVGPNPRGSQYVDPGGLVVMELGNRVRGVVSQIEDGAGPMAVEIDLTRARIRIDERFDSVEILERDPTVKTGPDVRAAYATQRPPDGMSVRTNIATVLAGLLEDLLADGPLECDAGHGAAAIEVLVAAHLSHRRGHVPVRLPLESKEDCDLWLPVT